LPGGEPVKNWTELKGEPSDLSDADYLGYWLSLKMTDAPLFKVLDRISAMTGVDFAYSNMDIPVGQKVSIDVEHVTLAEALNQLFADAGLSWKAMAGNHIIVTKGNDSNSGSGTLKGKVYDAESKTVLPGATVMIKGTSIGASTDLNGNFTINNVPSGEQTFVISYVGYITLTEIVNVPSGQTLEKDFYLSPTAVQGKAVVVTAQAQGQMQAINQQLSSNTIINVVSSEKIHQLPDYNASAALSRLPGVSVMNGDQIVIRGAQAKLNEIMINGVQLPSTDLNNRATDLGFVSSNMLSSIEVVKVLTPDMDANAIGGVVNLKLREAPENFHFDVLTQGMYNGQDRTTDNYKFWASASDRFFNNKLGVFLQGEADRSDVGDWNGSANYVAVGDPSYGYYSMNSYTYSDQWNIYSNYNASLILDYRLPYGHVVLQNSYSNGLNDLSNYQNVLNFTAPNNIQYTMSRQKYGKDLMVNGLEAENSFGIVKVDLTLSHSYADQYTRLGYGGGTAYTTNFLYFQNPNDQPFINSQGQVISYLNQIATLTPEQVHQIIINPADALGAYQQGWMGDDYPRFHANIYNGALDVSVPVNFSNTITAQFKGGGKFYQTVRDNTTTEYFDTQSIYDGYSAVQKLFPASRQPLSSTNPLRLTDILNPNFYNQRGKYFLNGVYPFNTAWGSIMDEFMLLAPSGWSGGVVYQPGIWDRTWHGTETLTAGYAMATLNFGPRLTLLGGVRFEHYNMNYRANNVYVIHEVYGDALNLDTLNTVNRNDDHLFPNVQLHYKINDWADLRLAYTQGISRPDYTAIIPDTYYAPGADAHAGNTNLKPDISTNYDIALSLHNNELGLLTIAPFYKKIVNIFYQNNIEYQFLSKYGVSFPNNAFWASMHLQAPTPTFQVTAYLNNPNPAYVRGVEVDWQTNFWYLPAPLNGLVLDANYTKAGSNMAYQIELNSTVPKDTVINGRRQTIFNPYVTDTTRTGRLLYQANDVVNVALGYDYKGFSARLSFQMTGNILTYLGTWPQQDQYTGNIYSWSFLAEQKLPIPGLRIDVSGVNIFHNPVYTYQLIRRGSNSAPLTKNQQSIDYSPSLWQVGLRYSF
jgi:TonB-dependent receptor